jgi:hypothetical protein
MIQILRDFLTPPVARLIFNILINDSASKCDQYIINVWVAKKRLVTVKDLILNIK